MIVVSSYTYSLTSPAWSDPSGSYSATLDRFERPTAVNDPVNATDFTWTYRADGQPSAFAQPNGNTTIFAHDEVGRLTSKDTGSLAQYDWTYNRAGQVLTEASAISGDPANGIVTYTHDPLERLTGATLAGQSTVTYGWDTVPNRTSVQVGAGTPATTTYDAADRPTSGANPSAAYTSDEDGRLTAAPSYQYAWDHLGRLTTVTNSGGTTLATYTYDPLDRLRLVDYGAGNRIRFRYTGLTTAVAQWLDDATGTVTRSVANGWTGERLADWTGSGSNLRIYGTNAHHDTTWLATGTGSVSQALRYDPWGTPRGTVPTGYSPFRFQGSWLDATSNLSWVVTRWYAPSLGRFISEDSLLGTPVDPPSRHLYAYAEGEPIGRWDPDGRRPVKYGEFRLRKTRIEHETKNQWRTGADIACVTLNVFALRAPALGLAVDAACNAADLVINDVEGLLSASTIVKKYMWTTDEPGRGIRVAYKRAVQIAVNGRIVETRWPRHYTEWADIHFNYLPRTSSGSIRNPGWPSNAWWYYKAYEKCVARGFDDGWPNGPFWRCYDGAFSYRYRRVANPDDGTGYGEVSTPQWKGYYVEGGKPLKPGRPDRRANWSYTP